MTDFVPYFAGLITLMFAAAFYFIIKEPSKKV
jgi:hypothetical protein